MDDKYALNGRRIVTDVIELDTGPYHQVKGLFEAEKYEGSPLMDTNVTLTIPEFGITWTNRQKFMQELANLIGKYQI